VTTLLDVQELLIEAHYSKEKRELCNCLGCEAI